MTECVDHVLHQLSGKHYDTTESWLCSISFLSPTYLSLKREWCVYPIFDVYGRVCVVFCLGAFLPHRPLYSLLFHLTMRKKWKKKAHVTKCKSILIHRSWDILHYICCTRVQESAYILFPELCNPPDGSIVDPAVLISPCSPRNKGGRERNVCASQLRLYVVSECT